MQSRVPLVRYETISTSGNLVLRNDEIASAAVMILSLSYDISLISVRYRNTEYDRNSRMWTNPILFVIRVTSSNILLGYSKLEFLLFLIETS